MMLERKVQHQEYHTTVNLSRMNIILYTHKYGYKPTQPDSNKDKFQI
jgi:hypothetical protein